MHSRRHTHCVTIVLTHASAHARSAFLIVGSLFIFCVIYCQSLRQSSSLLTLVSRQIGRCCSGAHIIECYKSMFSRTCSLFTFNDSFIEKKKNAEKLSAIQLQNKKCSLILARKDFSFPTVKTPGLKISFSLSV